MRILVPVDFSKPSLGALGYAIEFGRPLKAEITVLHVVEPFYAGTPDVMYGLGYDAGVVYRELESSAREQLATLAAKLRPRRISVRTLLMVGTAFRVIPEAARKTAADLIVMATHGRTGLSHVVIGSVAERVVRTAPCPVLTLRPSAAARSRRALSAARRPRLVVRGVSVPATRRRTSRSIHNAGRRT
jgi:universal stress protein A